MISKPQSEDVRASIHSTELELEPHCKCRGDPIYCEGVVIRQHGELQGPGRASAAHGDGVSDGAQVRVYKVEREAHALDAPLFVGSEEPRHRCLRKDGGQRQLVAWSRSSRVCVEGWRARADGLGMQRWWLGRLMEERQTNEHSRRPGPCCAAGSQVGSAQQAAGSCTSTSTMTTIPAADGACCVILSPEPPYSFRGTPTTARNGSWWSLWPS